MKVFNAYYYIGWMVLPSMWIEEWDAFRQAWDAYLLNLE